MAEVSYDPQPLAAIAQERFRDRPWVARALASCNAGYWEGTAYFRFVGSRTPPDPGPESDWREQGLWVEQPEDGCVLQGGWVLLDIAADGRVRGLLFFERLPPEEKARPH